MRYPAASGWALALLALASPAFAQGPPPAAKGPSLALAVEAAQTAVSTCAANGYKVTALVVDSAGAVKAALAADGAFALTFSIATRKAHTALAYKVATSQIATRVQTDPALAAAITADSTLIPWPGAQPIMSGADIIGAMAVSGAPGGDKDDACVTAALAKIKDRL